MKEYTDSGYKIQEFDSFSEVADYLESIPDLYDYTMTKKDELSKSFHGVSSFDGIFDRLRYGDKVQTENFINELKDLDTFDEIDVGIFRDVEGFAYDMGSVVNGEPECCLNFGSPEAKPTLNMYIDIGYNGGVEVETINYRGYAIIKLINTLISKGYILNIYVVHYITTYDGRYSGDYAQLFKVPTNFLTLSTIGYSCCCDFFRVVSWLLTAIQSKCKTHSGDGRSMPNSKIIEAIKERGDLYIPSGYTDGSLNVCSKERAEELVMGYYNDYVNRKEGKELNNDN